MDTPCSNLGIDSLDFFESVTMKEITHKLVIPIKEQSVWVKYEYFLCNVQYSSIQSSCFHSVQIYTKFPKKNLLFILLSDHFTPTNYFGQRP